MDSDHAVRKPILSKTPVWKAATLGAVLGLAMVPYPARAAPGGLSGKPLLGPSTACLAAMYRLTGTAITIVKTIMEIGRSHMA